MVYNHLGGCYRPNNSRQIRYALRTNCVIQSPETQMYSARKEVYVLFIVGELRIYSYALKVFRAS